MRRKKAKRNVSQKTGITRKTVIVLGVVVLVVACVCLITFAPRTPKTNELKPRTLEELLALPDESLAKVDIARMNLLCATGLPHAENIDVDKYLATLDEWAKIIWEDNEKRAVAYYRNPAKYENSLSKFKAVNMVLVIQQQLRCGYNMELIRSGAMQDYTSLRFNEDSRDIFIHGLVERQKGSCASLPVLVVALGRRCGYPLYLVSAKGHPFVRWEDDKERFNIEAAMRGTDIYPDEHYHDWPFPTDEEERAKEKFLKTHTPVEELCMFMHVRGSCLHSHNRFREAEEAYTVYLRGFPESRFIHGFIAEVQRKARWAQ